MHQRSDVPHAHAEDRTRTDALEDLIRGVGDDSPPKEKALFTLWAGLQDITNDFPNHRSAQIARQAIERAAQHLVDRPATGACPEHGWRGGSTGAQACPACTSLDAWDKEALSTREEQST